MQPANEGTTVVVVAGGASPDPRVRDRLPIRAVVVAADSGADHAVGLGLRVDHLIGDLDSVLPESLAAVRESGGLVHRHPTEKDETDLELALGLARSLGATRIVVVGGHGERADHGLANVLALSGPDLSGRDVTAWHGSDLLTVVRDRRDLSGAPGSLLSLVPVHGAAIGVDTQGLAYPLVGEDLPPGTTRGVSNVLVGGVARVSVASGVLLAVQPAALDHPTTDRGDVT